MLQPTNLIVTNPYQINVGGTTVAATLVDVCDVCGGLFVRPGTGLYFGAPHSH